MNTRSVFLLSLLAFTQAISSASAAADYQVNPLTAEQKKAYLVNGTFYKKGIVVQDILIATSERVADHALLEAAYQFDMVMRSIDAQIAQRIRDKKVLCILIGDEELTSVDRQYLAFGEAFERDFVGQGEEEPRSLEQTLSLAWLTLSILPQSELTRLDQDELDRYYGQT